MKIFFSSDYHFGEERLALLNRPFKTPQEHCEHIITNHNEVVGVDDLTYVNGDVLFKGADPAIYMPMIARMNGRKILIRGNHDVPFTNEQFAPYFEDIIPEGEGVHLVVKDIPCYITHYPTCAVKDKFNLVGHIHSAWKLQLNMYNIGIDANHFRPVSEDAVAFNFKAICDFYDNDVWVAYSDINHGYFTTRGKKSTYFQKTK